MEYVKGSLDGHEVVAVVCGEGKVASAICAQTLILEYGVDRVINTGVAGTLCQELGIQDVAIAQDVVQHDMDVTALGLPLGQIPSLDVLKIPCDGAMIAALEQSVQAMGCNHRVGTIASGDMFLHTQERKQFIVEHFDAIAGEMEGASIGQVCYLNHVPFVVLRTISDDASGHAPASFETFANEAAQLACRIVRDFVSRLEG
jgi:adenosylhomocysteine nucleosidase